MIVISSLFRRGIQLRDAYHFLSCLISSLIIQSYGIVIHINGVCVLMVLCDDMLTLYNLVKKLDREAITRKSYALLIPFATSCVQVLR